MSSTLPSILKRLLEGLASQSDPCFSGDELRAQWPEECDALIRLGLLKATTDVLWIDPELGSRRRVVTIDGKRYLLDPDAPGREPVPVRKSDISRIRLHEREFAKWIASTNNLSGKQEFSGPLWTLGNRNIQGTQMQFHYVSAARCEAALGAVLNAGETVPIGRVVVVLSATLDWVDALTLKSLTARRVVVAELEGLIDGPEFNLKRIELPPLESATVSGLEVIHHIDRRFDTLGKEYSGLQKENELLKQRLAEQLMAIGKKVEPKFFHWIVTILGAGSTNAASKLLGIPNSTLAEGMKKFEEKGGLYRTLAAMVRARQQSIGKKSIERFNEEFIDHQRARGDFQSDPDLLQTVLEGLEQMDASNWKSVQKELLKMLLEVVPEK
jgi:hypothetical protein